MRPAVGPGKAEAQGRTRLDLKVEDLDVPAHSVQVLYLAHLELVQGQLLQPVIRSVSHSLMVSLLNSFSLSDKLNWSTIRFDNWSRCKQIP